MSHTERTERYFRMLSTIGAPKTESHVRMLADARANRAKRIRSESRFSVAARDERFVMIVTARAFYAVARRISATSTRTEE